MANYLKGLLGAAQVLCVDGEAIPPLPAPVWAARTACRHSLQGDFPILCYSARLTAFLQQV